MQNKKTTRRGVFINLEDSNIKVDFAGETFVFSSNKKREVFLKRVDERINKMLQYTTKIYRVVNDNRVYGFAHEFYLNIYKDVYKNMLYK